MFTYLLLVSCPTVAPLNVLAWVLPVESIRRLAAFFILESPNYQFSAGVGQTESWGGEQAGPTVVSSPALGGGVGAHLGDLTGVLSQ